MPSSYHQQISKIMDLVIRLNPHSILDIGPGFGKYGLLCREYLEMWGQENLDAQYGKWRRKIDSIEAYRDYITPIHHYIYDKTYVGDAVDIIDRRAFPRYDLVLLIDVLEHFPKHIGYTLLAKLLRRNKGVLISTPKQFFEQGAGFGNDYETHRSVWTKSELEDMSKRCEWVDDECSLICYLSI